MRIQTAIDRVTVERAVEIIEQIGDAADIIEIGTSLIKEYGISGSVRALKERFPGRCFLADIKTCDEGAYEFEKVYEAGADIATVMGFSSMDTIASCADIARKYQKEYFIDLLEVEGDRLGLLADRFPDAIFGIHLASDKGGKGLENLVQRMCEILKGVSKIAAAGGVRLETLGLMKDCGVDTVIVGGAITKAPDIHEAASAFASGAKDKG